MNRRQTQMDADVLTGRLAEQNNHHPGIYLLSLVRVGPRSSAVNQNFLRIKD